MKFIPAIKGSTHTGTLELSRRNLETLLAKLDDPNSARTLLDPEHQIIVTAVENEVHYSDRAPGTVYMPTSGETL